jgi:hypothetical protein
MFKLSIYQPASDLMIHQKMKSSAQHTYSHGTIDIGHLFVFLGFKLKEEDEIVEGLFGER